MRTVAHLAEIGHNEANQYAYEGEWGIRRNGHAAWIENFAAESKETRIICHTRAVLNAFIDDLIAEARGITYWKDASFGDDNGDELYENVADWLQAKREG